MLKTCKAKILLFCFVLGKNNIILLFNLVVKLRVEKVHIFTFGLKCTEPVTWLFVQHKHDNKYYLNVCMVADDKLRTANVKNCSTVIWWCVCAASYCRAGCPTSRISEWEFWCVWWCWTSWGSNNWRNHCLYTPPEWRGAEEWSDSHGNTLLIHVRNPKPWKKSMCACNQKILTWIKVRPCSWSACLAPC